MKDQNIKIRTKDEREIDDITHQFFDLFTNTDNKIPDLQKIKEIFLPGGLLINNTSHEAAIYNLDSFIKPREEILTNGTLSNFIEKETSHKSEIFGKIARRVSNYKKSGEFNGEAFIGEGKKLLQFIKLKDHWVLFSVLWQDK